jgi:hypothetical protein
VWPTPLPLQFSVVRYYSSLIALLLRKVTGNKQVVVGWGNALEFTRPGRRFTLEPVLFKGKLFGKAYVIVKISYFFRPKVNISTYF